MKRIGIFVFYDKAGIADNYVYYLLENMMNVLDDLIIVANGVLDIDAKTSFQKYTNQIYTRDNNGFDAEAYREVILNPANCNTWNSYDQVVLFNDTFYGPFIDMNLIFDEMQKQEVDFWGLSKYKAGMSGLFDQQILPDHIQGYFIVIGSRILQSLKFIEFWNNMPEIRTYKDAIKYFEVNLTQYFLECGFTYGTWLDRNGENNYLEPGVAIYNKYPYELIRFYDFPLIKRKALKILGIGIFDFRNTKKVLEYIRDYRKYDVEMIIEHLSRIKKGEMCEFFSYSSLLEFYRGHSKLYVYGHGKYALILQEFFEFMRWKIEAFIVTNIEKKEIGACDKIISIKDVQIEKDDGIVVALSKKNVSEVKDSLELKYSDDQLLFPYWE